MWRLIPHEPTLSRTLGVRVSREGVVMTVSELGRQAGRLRGLGRARLWALTFLVCVVGLFLVASLPAEGAQETSTIAIEGTVTINDKPAWVGVKVEVTNEDGEVCAVAELAEGGKYAVDLEAEKCKSGDQVVFRLKATGTRAAETVGVVMADQPQVIDVSFSVSPEEEVLLPPRPGAASGPGEPSAVGTALVQQTSSVFDEVQLMLLGLLIAASAVLIGMAVAHYFETSRRYKFLEAMLDRAARSEGDAEQLIEAVKLEASDREQRSRVSHTLVEGLVLTFVVIALVALGAAGKITQEGIVSVLAAMVGYAAGRAAS